MSRKKLFDTVGYVGLLLWIASALAYTMSFAWDRLWIGWLVGASCIVTYTTGNFGMIRSYFLKRSARYRTNAILMVLLLFGILVLVEAFSAKHYKRFDLTSNKRHTLTEQSINILKKIDCSVHVTAFLQETTSGWEKAKDLLGQYAYHCKTFSFELVDPDRYPGKAKHFKITNYETFVLESNDREEKVIDISEEQLTNAILRVIRGQKKTIYFLTGHGERSIEDISREGYSAVREEIEAQNYHVNNLLLMRSRQIPKDAGIIIIAGPGAEIFAEEERMLNEFMQGAGNIIVLIDPKTRTGFPRFLEPYGVKVGNDIIIDKLSNVLGADYLTPIISKYAAHPITQDFKTASFFPLVRSITSFDDKQNHVTELAFTGEQSWAESNLDGLNQGRVSFDPEEDIKGSVSIAVVCEVESETEEKTNNKHDKTKRSSIVVFGDSDFVSNGYLNLSGNRDLFMNTLGWLSREANLITIRPRSKKSAPVLLSSMEGKNIFWLSAVFLPSTILLVGVVVLHYRRKKAVREF